jgi:hypothetical protein
MPDITAQTPDGTSHVFPDGTPDEVIDKAMKQHMQSIPSPEAVAAVNPIKEPQPLAGKMEESPLAPSYRSWKPLTREQSNSGNTGAAAGVMGAAAILNPATAIRSGLKSLAGSQVGKYGGRAIGHLVGGQSGAETGEKWGEYAGAAVGPFVSGRSFAKLPFVGRMVATPEDIAANRVEQQVATRAAQVKAGLRKPPEGYPSVESPANRPAGAFTGRSGRTWNAGDLAEMPREQLAGEYAKEMRKPMTEQDQEWLTALRAESMRNTKGMYPGAAASTKGGAR